jgi:hypothetical protein
MEDPGPGAPEPRGERSFERGEGKHPEPVRGGDLSRGSSLSRL